MMLAAESYFQLSPDLKICRILDGMWQVSGTHGPINPEAAVQEMLAYHDYGFTTWDLADIYGPAEDFIGEFRTKLASTKGEEELDKSQAHTKFVPSPGPMQKEVVSRAINLSKNRMNVDSIDLVQFHWWDYAHNAYHDALQHLTSLKDEGKIRHIGLTNFDTEHMEIIKDWGIDFVSNQVQYSIVDQRPSKVMEKFSKQNNVFLFSYGTLCGGLFSEKYLGVPELSSDKLDTASLQKYAHMVEAWGGWPLFQELLQVCNLIAKKHEVSIANVATRFVLDKPQVAGVIIGTRLGVSDHKKDNEKVFSFKLDSDDLNRISEVTSKSSDLFSLIGDCGEEYRMR